MSLFVKRHLPIIFVNLTIIVLAVLATDTVYLVVDMTASERNTIQVFWTGRDGNYSLDKLVTRPTKKGRRKYVISLRDAVFIERIRVDIQQGREKTIPASVILHSLSLQYRWLFHDAILDTSLAGIDTVRHIVADFDEEGRSILTFVDPDPWFEFDFTMRPVYHQFFLPILFFLVMHYLLYGYFFRKRGNRFLIGISTAGHDSRLPGEVIALLQGSGLTVGTKKHVTLPESQQYVFSVEAPSVELLRSILKPVSKEADVARFWIVAAESGDIR